MDRAEAVGNIETAFTSVLNSFHSLYDAIAKEFGSHPINWYSTAELATVLAMRNARHHNNANRIRTLYTYHVDETKDPTDFEPYVLVDFSLPPDSPGMMNLHVSWIDFDTLLSLPVAESKLRPDTCRTIRTYLASDKFSGYARRLRLAKKRIFVNAAPLLVNAGATILPIIQNSIHPSSIEAETFAGLFATADRVDTSSHELRKIRFLLPH